MLSILDHPAGRTRRRRRDRPHPRSPRQHRARDRRDHPRRAAHPARSSSNIRCSRRARLAIALERGAHPAARHPRGTGRGRGYSASAADGCIAGLVYIRGSAWRSSRSEGCASPRVIGKSAPFGLASALGEIAVEVGDLVAGELRPARRRRGRRPARRVLAETTGATTFGLVSSQASAIVADVASCAAATSSSAASTRMSATVAGAGDLLAALVAREVGARAVLAA